MKKRLLAIILSSMMLMPTGTIAYAAVAPPGDTQESPGANVIDELAGGECGTNIKWTLYADGELVISGTGEMKTYNNADTKAPWYEMRNSIKKVTIKPGVTTVGKYSFYECVAITSVTIPDGVTAVKHLAFGYCSSLEKVTIPNSVAAIANYAFYGCEKLMTVKFGNGVKSIGTGAFQKCETLLNVTIPDSVTAIDPSAFRQCSELASIKIPISVKYIGQKAFADNANLSDIYYAGTEDNWKVINTDAETVPGAHVHYLQTFNEPQEYEEHITEAERIHDGKIEQVCTCNYVKSEGVIETTEPDYFEVAKEATYPESGVITFICAHCRGTYTKTIPMADDNRYGNVNISMGSPEGDNSNALIFKLTRSFRKLFGVKNNRVCTCGDMRR